MEYFLNTVKLAVILLVIALIGYLVISKAQIQGDLANIQVDYQACQIANKNYYAEAQASQERENRANALLKAATEMANKMDAQNATLLQSKPDNSDDCKAAHDFINQNVVRK